MLRYYIVLIALGLFVAQTCDCAPQKEFIPCGISDIDQIRKEVEFTPTTESTYTSRRAALARWWRLLWHQGIDMQSMSKQADYISRFKPEMEKAHVKLDEAFAVLERIQASPEMIPEVKGKAGKPGTQTDWPMYLSTDGGNTGYSPDTGPSEGKIVWKFPNHYSWDARPVMKHGKIYVSAPGSDVVGYCLNAATGKTLWRARQYGFDLYTTRGLFEDPVVTENRVLFNKGLSGQDLVVDRVTGATVDAANVSNEEADGDGELIFSVLRSGRVRVADGATGKPLWVVKVPGRCVTEPVHADGKLYMGFQNGSICRVDIQSRRVEWRQNITGEPCGGLSVEAGHLSFGTRDGSIYCLDIEDGDILWSWKCKEKEERALRFFSTPREAGGRIYVGAASGFLYCLDASKGTLAWKYKTGSWIRSRPLVIGKNVYLATLDSYLYAIVDKGSKPHKRGRVKLGEHGFTADLVGDKNRILLSGKDYILYSVSLNGKLQWRHGIIDGTWIDGEFFASSWIVGFMTSPAVVDGVMYIGGPDGFVKAVDAETGTLKWQFELGGILSGVPVVAEGKVFVGCQTKGPARFCALDTETGNVVWETDRFGLTWVAPAYNDGILFVGNRAGDMLGVNARDGSIIWSYYTAKDTPLEHIPRDTKGEHGFPPGVYSNPAIDNDTVYVGSWSGYYFALDQKTGARKWRTKTALSDGGLPDSAAPMLHKGHLYVQKAGRYIAALDKKSGKLAWEWKAPEGYLQNGTVVAMGNKVYGSFVRGVTKLPYHATIVAFNDVENGSTKLWQYDGGGGLTAPVVADGKIIFGSSADMFVTCLNPDTGAVLWRTFTGGEMLENVPALYGNKVFLQCKNGWVYAIR